jgi:hypothetical protein
LAQEPEGTVVQKQPPYNLPASMSPALDNMKVVTELMAGLTTSHTSLRSLENRNAINMAANTAMNMHETSMITIAEFGGTGPSLYNLHLPI